MAIKDFKTKQEEKLFLALQKLIRNCVDTIGIPKTPTIKQLRSAQDVLFKYERQSTYNK